MSVVGLIVTACLATQPSCKAADPRTCHSLNTCQDFWVDLVNEDGTEITNLPTDWQCNRFGQFFIAKPQGWLDSNPDFRFLNLRCATRENYDKNRRLKT
jgi:hypothetical protein